MGFFRRSEPTSYDRRSEYMSEDEIAAAEKTVDFSTRDDAVSGLVTPEQVHNIAFSKPPIGLRGYNEDEVDAFLDMVETTIAELQRRLSEYEEQ